MSTIRRQSIISSVIVYIGFALGFLNTYLFAREGGFTKEEYGLTNTFIAIANIMFSLASFGMTSYVVKFFPYYKDRLTTKKNDLITIALAVSCIGFIVVVLLGVVFKGEIVERFKNSPGVLQYYALLFPFGFGLTIYSVLEAYAWQYRKSVLTSFLKEVFFRFGITILIVLTTFGFIRKFDTFISIYAFLYLFIAVALLVYLISTHKLSFTFSISHVTKRFFSKIVALVGFVWGGQLIFTISTVFDTIVLAAVMPNGMAYVAVFSLAQNIGSLIQAPQRGIIASSVGPLSRAWKDKDYNKINTIYHRSSINQLLFALAMFCLIWLNFNDGIETFRLQEGYKAAQIVFLFIGLTKIIDMGTGVNQQIIGTSTFWRFEFLTGVVLLSLALPLNYFLTKEYGLIGPAISNLIAFTIYNGIRYFFLLKKFKMQPFSKETIYSLLLAAASFLICHLLFGDRLGLLWIAIRSFVFIVLFVAGAFIFNLTPDLKPVLQTVKKRLFRKA